MLQCITTDDLLDSIKKNVINGRYTPPTSMFDSVYGNKSIDNSSVNTSFNDIGMKYVNYFHCTIIIFFFS